MTFLQEELGVAQASLREKNVAVSFTLYPISSRNSTGKWHSAQVRNLTLALEGFTRQRDNELAGVSGRDDFLKFYFNTILALYTAQQFLIHAGLSQQVERTAEARVAREQKRAAEQEEAARCNHNHEQHDGDHSHNNDHES